MVSIQIPDDFVPKKYSRKEEAVKPWPLKLLQSMPTSESDVFFPCSSFAVHRSLSKSPAPIIFPPEMLYSHNYFHPQWSLSSHRRVKNVIVVMEWIPDPARVRLSERGRALLPEQEGRLKKAFDRFDVDGVGSIGKPEVQELLRCLDVPCAFDLLDIDQWMRVLDTNGDGRLDFREFRDMMVRGKFTGHQDGRFFVALSLEEAESLRGVIHMSRLTGGSLFQDSESSIALLAGSLTIDSSKGYTKPSAYQANTVRQAYRFMDTEFFFEDWEISVIVRALQATPMADRLLWFEEVRECRRRQKMDTQDAPVRRIGAMADEFHVLELRSRLIQIGLLIKKKGMMLLDAFRAFDHDRNGLLDCSELYGALEWLGLSVTAQDVYDLVRNLDQDHNGKINYQEFANAFRGFYGQAEDDWRTGKGELELLELHGAIKPKPIRELSDIDAEAKGKKKRKSAEELVGYDPLKGVPLSSKVLRVKKRDVMHYVEVWNSKLTPSREKLSIWAPKNEGYTRTSKILLVIGHYASSSFSKPARNASYFSLTDEECNGVAKSIHLDARVVNQLFPHPIKYKEVWSQKQGDSKFYAWQAIPPDDDFVALGMLGTTTPQEPALTEMRCIPRRLLKECKDKPKKIWDDSGTGGRAGSVWTVSPMQLLYVTAGHAAPTGPFYVLNKDQLMCDLGVGDQPPPKGYAPIGTFTNK